MNKENLIPALRKTLRHMSGAEAYGREVYPPNPDPGHTTVPDVYNSVVIGDVGKKRRARAVGAAALQALMPWTSGEIEKTQKEGRSLSRGWVGVSAVMDTAVGVGLGVLIAKVPEAMVLVPLYSAGVNSMFAHQEIFLDPSSKKANTPEQSSRP